ncbi:hypothetical protein FOL47_008989 [Perkinsus chesapeaki]|uniref:RING-type domain-containing protein n=1 Tax=Perkinsus chesapeaki TaxID=330153 RepID=A0A7J6MSK9_PERCH|nr:hypothetical protein FOL47_008989 [Perkinsus chesapeaki]
MTPETIETTGVHHYDSDMDAIIMMGSLCMAVATMAFVIYVHVAKERFPSLYDDADVPPYETSTYDRQHNRFLDASVMTLQSWLSAAHNSHSSAAPCMHDNGFASSSSSLDCCSVCLSAYDPEDTITVLQCGHLFHEDCARKWMSVAHVPVCPLCRHSLLAPLPPPI